MNQVPKKAVWKQLTTLIPVYETLFMLGCSGGWLSNAVYFLLEDKNGEIHATTQQCALIASFGLIGKAAFAIPAGILTDKYGRKKVIISVTVLFVFINASICLNYSLITIYVSRLFEGLAEAIIFATSLITIGEISSPEIRGRLTNIGVIILNIGSVSPSIISVIFPSYKALTWGVTILSVLGLLPMFWVLETPSFLISVSKLDRAKDNLRRIRPDYSENDINEEFEKLKVYVEDEKAHRNEVSWLKFVKSRSIRKPLIIGALLSVFTGLVGTIVVKIYISVIIPSNNFVPRKFYPLISQIVSFAMSICTAFYIDWFPRRTLYLSGTLAMATVIATSAVANFFMVGNQYEDIAKWVFTAGNIFLLVFYGASVHPLNYTLSSELYPQAVKGLCGSIALIAETASCIAVLHLYSLIIEYSQLYVLYGIFLVNTLFLFSTTYFLLPEGRGVLLSELQREFGSEADFIVSNEVAKESSLLENSNENSPECSNESH